jgi:glycosyltransferase involved in cell wall biosynthesis
MSILLLNNRYRYCGIGEYTFSLYQALNVMQRDEVKLLSWKGDLVEKIYLRIRENNFLQYPEEALRVLSQLIFMLKVPRKHAVYHLTNSSLSLIAKWIKPCVVTVHDLIPFACPRDFTDHLIQKSTQALNHADMIICVSYYTQKDLLRYIDVDPCRIRVIHEGVDHNTFKPRDKSDSREMLGLPKDKNIILHVGNEEPRKNIPLLIKAFAKLQKKISDAVLVRIGEKTETSQTLIHSFGIDEKVIYFKNVENLQFFYNAADMLVFPSYFEGFGFPALQAMASECPVVASNATSIPEIVGDAGILLSPSDVDGFVNWMYNICTNQELKMKLMSAGYKRSQLFSWEKCAQETLKVYKEIENCTFS